MEYSALVQNCGFGSLLECGSVPEEDDHLIEELLMQGCWVESSGVGSCSDANYIDQEEAKRWWIAPCSSVKDRLVVAVAYLRESTKNNSNLLIQIWVPMRTGLDYHTPLDDSSVAFPINLVNPTNFNSNVNLRFFRCDDYPRLPPNYDVPGSLSLALPVFERGTAACLGVLHFLMPLSDTINYRPQLDTNILFNAFEGVDFRSSCENLQIPPTVKVFEEMYEAAVNEIVEVLTCVCKTQNLPLGLTWAPCIQQGGKCGYGHSTENYVSTVDRACFVADPNMLGFQEACSEQHLFRGQGIVGTAFSTAKPCFAIDITAFTKAEYPLSHHANLFGLHAAVAIPLRSVYADFVLELFLPRDCHHREQQRHLLNSLSLLLQQACRTLHVVTDDQFTFHPHVTNTHKSDSSLQLQGCGSWISHMMEAQAQAQQKGKGVCVSLEYLQEAEPKQEFKVTTNCNYETAVHEQVFSDFAEESHTHTHTHGHGGHSFGGRRGRKAGEKRRTKAEKTISLPVLRQYFAGSLKDAAKSIGVCPTTLKRICRQHGITRWPSRKIKKVGHSLKKLQLVIDSVQGAEGAIQIGSFYNSFPELNNSSTSESSKSKNNNNNNNNNNTVYAHGLKSPSSSSPSTVVNTASQSPVPQHFMTTSNMSELTCPTFRVKATFADEKIRFSLQPMWGFTDLQLEIARRFNLNDMSNVVLKYLDDEGEWVVLACDGDLEECKDLHTTSHSRTIRLALFQASPLNLPNTFANNSPS